MAVIIVAEVHGQTETGYSGMLKVLQDRIRLTEGFVLHAGYRVDGAWRVLEVWQSKVDADQFFANHVAPNLPPGVRPKRSVYEAHSLVTPSSGTQRP
jgi:hypothetical protein